MRRLALVAALLGLSVVASPVPAQADDAVVFADGFETGDLSLWDNVATGRYGITNDPAHVATGTYALEGTIPAGEGWGEINKWFLPGYDEIYVRFDVMFEDGFQNLREDGNGMHFASVSGNHIDNKWSAHGKAGIVPSGYDFFTTTVDPEHPYGDDALHPFMFYSYFPDMACCYGNVFKQSEPKMDIVPGRWHELIIHVDAGTPGQYDGSQQLWIDGELKIDVQDMKWRDTTDLRLNEFAIVDYMPGSPKTQHIWFDNVLVTTGFPGTDVGTPTTFIDVTSTHLFFAQIEWLADTGVTKGCNPPRQRHVLPQQPGHQRTDGRIPHPGPPATGRYTGHLHRRRRLRLPSRHRRPRRIRHHQRMQPTTQRHVLPRTTRSPEDRWPHSSPGPSSYRPVPRTPSPTTTTSVFEADIDALAASGVTKGCNPPHNDMYCPNNPVTRGQMAAFLYRALGP